MKRFRLSRRAMLRGMAHGAVTTLALPTLNAMLDDNGTAYAQDAAPLHKRFGVFFWGNGVRLAKWRPSDTGAGYTLSEELAPLANVKDYVSIVSGMNIQTGNERGHHAGAVGILSGSPMISQDPMGAPYASTFSAPSIDQVVASQIEAGAFRSLELGISRRVVSGEGTTLHYLSHNGPDNANPPEYSPRAVFTRLFGNGFVAPGGQAMVDPRLALRRSVLDAVLADANALRARVGSADRARLDQHLDSIRALENQIAMIEDAPPAPNACMAPGDPGDVGNEMITQINDAMADLLALSLACDRTRVFSIMYSGGVALTVYNELGITTEHHGLSHDEPGDQPQMHQITTFIMAKLATFLERLQATPEGDGNLLDNCAILASSDVSEGQPHSIDDYPIIIAGRAGGALVHPGIHYRSGNGENTSNALLSLLQAMDLDLTEYGNAGGHTTTPLAAIKA